MAKLSPPLDIINGQKIPPTSGELCLLNFLQSILDNSYEIYFQPFLNGDQPDIAILRRNGGLLFIEVKECNLDHYEMYDVSNWISKKSMKRVMSPTQQVKKYKDRLFNLHSSELQDKASHDSRLYGRVCCAIYFHNATEMQLIDFYKDNISDEKFYKRNYYTQMLGKDSLTKEMFLAYLDKIRLTKNNYNFDYPLYISIQRFLIPPLHKIEDGLSLKYTQAQKLLIESVGGQRRKIKGVAGSGKTYVLAKIAANAQIRTNSRVLILTFNIALRNYIHDRINDVRENFDWNNFYITNYHQFFKAQAIKYMLDINELTDFEDKKFFESQKSRIIPYQAIFIDEIQDYKQEWLDLIIEYFSDINTELKVFGDEKQNIYDRELDSNKEPIVRTIVGQWNRSLSQSFRLFGYVANIAIAYQDEILSKKYKKSDMSSESKSSDDTLNLDNQVLKYYYCKGLNQDEITEQIFRVIKNENIHSSDVAILSSSIEMIRDINDIIINTYNEKTTITFETNEESEKYIKRNHIIKDIRRQRRNNFWFKTGTIKLSTIHSFKGWEIQTVFLLIEDDGEKIVSPELVYTGITRAKYNLIVFNLGNAEQHAFFKEHAIDTEELISSTQTTNIESN